MQIPMIETFEAGNLYKPRYDWMRFDRIQDKSYIGHPLRATYFVASIPTSRVIAHPKFIAAHQRLRKNQTIRNITVRGPYPDRYTYFKWVFNK